MKNPRRLLHAATAALALAATCSTQAADVNGTWNVNSDGFWTDSGNWLSSTIADGSGFTASFINDITANRIVTLNGDRTIGNLIFSDNNASGSEWTVTGNTLTLAGTTPTITTTTNATISSIIAGTSGLVKAGAGTLTLGSVNTYTGQTTINTGTLKLGISASATNASTSALGSNAAGSNGTVVNSGATLDFNGYTVAKEVVTINGTGVGGNGALVNTGGTQSSAISYLTLGSDATIGGTGRFDLRNNSPILNMAGYTLTKKGSNTVYVTGGSITNAGNILVEQGEFAFAGVGTFSGTSGKTITVKNTATLTTSWSQVTVIGWDLQLENGAKLYSYNDSGSTQNTFSGTVKIGTTVKFDTSGVMNITGNIEDLSGSGSLEKNGGSSLTLTGTNTYTGGTAIKVGTLLVNNTTGSGTGTGAVTVASGASLGGTGALTGAVTVTGKIAPGSTGIESLKTGAVTWNGAASAGVNTNWRFELGSGNTADLLDITGNFTKGTGSVFRFDFLGSNFTGVFDLVKWSGSTTFTASNFSYENLGGGKSGTFTINGSTLQFTAVPEPTTAIAGLLLGVGLLRRRRTNDRA